MPKRISLCLLIFITFYNGVIKEVKTTHIHSKAKCLFLQHVIKKNVIFFLQNNLQMPFLSLFFIALSVTFLYFAYIQYIVLLRAITKKETLKTPLLREWQKIIIIQCIAIYRKNCQRLSQAVYTKNRKKKVYIYLIFIGICCLCTAIYDNTVNK